MKTSFATIRVAVPLQLIEIKRWEQRATRHFRRKDNFILSLGFNSHLESPFQASTIFHTFHAGSKKAYKWLDELKKSCPTQEPPIEEEEEEMLAGYEDVNMGTFDITKERADEITKNFDRLRIKLRQEGLMKGSYLFYIRKVSLSFFSPEHMDI